MEKNLELDTANLFLQESEPEYINHSESAFKESEHRFRLLIENSADAILIVNKNFEVTYASDTYFKVMGFKPEEMLGKRSIDQVYPEDLPAIKDHIETVMQCPGEPLKVVYRRVRKDGTVIWCEGIATNLFHEPVIKGIVINFRDVSERIQQEQALKYSEHRFRTLIEQSSEAIVVADAELKITYVSDSLCNVVGYKPEDIIGLPTLSLAHPDEKAMITEFLEEVLRNPGQPRKLVYKTKKKEGRYVWCERVTTNLLHDPTINGIVSNFRDVTERVEAERALRDSEYKFRSLIQNSSDAIIVADEHLQRVFVSESVSRITGFTAEEMLSQDSFSLAHPDDLASCYAFMAEVLKEPSVPKTLVYRSRRKDGTYIWLERVSTNLIHDPAIKGIISNLRDITDRKEKAQALEAFNEELKKSNEELDKFVYSVSHDLRAPLASVLGLVELAKSDESQEQVMFYLEHIKASVLKLDGFIKDILDYSKNARLGVREERIDFTQLVQGVVEHLKFMNGDTDVDLQVDLTNAPALFTSDRHRITVVLNNLVSNGIRYANPEAERPFVRVTVREQEGCVELVVADNGIGVHPDHQQKVFDMFFRASSSSSGSGLGLYIVAETIKKLQGTVSMESAPGVGTRFTVRIPDLSENYYSKSM